MSTEPAKLGRPTKYRESYCDEIISFFDEDPFTASEDNNGKPAYNACRLPTLERFAHNIGVHVDTLYEWASVHPVFSEAKKRALQLQKDILVQNGLIGAYDKTFAIFTCKAVAGMRDGGEVNTEDAPPLAINYTVVDARKDA